MQSKPPSVLNWVYLCFWLLRQDQEGIWHNSYMSRGTLITWGNIRTDFFIILKKTACLYPAVTGGWEGDTTPLFDYTTAALDYISATAAGHIQAWPLLFPVAVPPNAMSGVRWYIFLSVEEENTNWRKKVLGEQLQRDHIRKQRCRGVENIWPWGRLEVSCFL